VKWPFRIWITAGILNAIALIGLNVSLFLAPTWGILSCWFISGGVFVTALVVAGLKLQLVYVHGPDGADA